MKNVLSQHITAQAEVNVTVLANSYIENDKIFLLFSFQKNCFLKTLCTQLLPYQAFVLRISLLLISIIPT